MQVWDWDTCAGEEGSERLAKGVGKVESLGNFFILKCFEISENLSNFYCTFVFFSFQKSIFWNFQVFSKSLASFSSIIFSAWLNFTTTHLITSSSRNNASFDVSSVKVSRKYENFETICHVATEKMNVKPRACHLSLISIALFSIFLMDFCNYSFVFISAQKSRNKSDALKVNFWISDRLSTIIFPARTWRWHKRISFLFVLENCFFSSSMK